MKTKRFILVVAALLATAGTAAAGTNEVSALLQKGLFEEEANRNLDAAIQAYQAVVTQTDKNHQFAATAVFRLGECYRKQGKTNEANAQYQRILREFSDQTELVKLSREYAGSSVGASLLRQTGSPDVLAKLQQQITDAKAEIAADQRQIDEIKMMPLESRRVFAQQHFPNPVLNSLMQDATKTEQDLAKMKNNLGDGHPDVRGATATLKTIYQQIDAQVDGIVNGLVEKRNTAAAAVAALEKQIKEEGKSSAAGSIAAEQTVSTAPSEAEEIKRLQAMIKDSPDLINGRNSGGEIPLHKAVYANQFVVARFLLDNKADIEAVDSFARTPLLLAAQSGFKEMAELLMERGANVNATVSKERVAKDHMLNNGENGCTPLHYAALYGNKGVAEALMKHGAKVDARNEEGDTPLRMAARKGFKNVAEALLASGADVNAKNNNGATALFAAVGAGNKAIAELLLTHGADVNAGDSKGSTALLAAISAGNRAILDLLLANKADVNLKTKDGFTPLIAAVNANQLETVKLLSERGADAQAKMAEDHQITPRWTALDAAVVMNNNEMVKLLLENHADPNATFDLSDRGNVYQRGSTPLIMAVERGQKETVKILLAHQAEVNWKNAQGTTALYAALIKDDRELAALLLDHGADTEIRYTFEAPGGRYERSLLQLEAAGGKKEMAELLLAHGAKINAQDDSGRTALHLAASVGSNPMVELLLAHGADVNLKDEHGQTALDLAGNQNGPGNGFTVAPYGGTSPLSYQWRLNAPPGTAASQESIGMLLRRHGAISALERSTIRITRSGQQAGGVVFWQDAPAYNQHTLFEVIAYVYPHQLGLAYISPLTGRDRDPELPGFYFPDFAHVKIRRLEANGQTNIFNVDLETALSSGDCSKNMALMWGDIVELPELDHNVSENWEGLSQPIRDTLKKCLERQVDIIVKRKTNKVTLAPEPPAGAGTKAARILQLETDGSGKVVLPSFWLGDVVRAAKVLMASSDLTGLKVKRLDPATGKATWLVFNLEKVDEHSDLWLQDGDVIEAPEKQ